MPTLRPITAADTPFLQRLYVSTRADELAATGWPAAQIAAFLETQFSAQHAHWQTHYADARFDIVEHDGAPIGRLYVHRSTSELRIVDIALLPDVRGRGIGSALLNNLLAEAHTHDQRVSIHVERSNRALGLYQRLGFRTQREEGPYLLMHCTPAQAHTETTPNSAEIEQFERLLGSAFTININGAPPAHLALTLVDVERGHTPAFENARLPFALTLCSVGEHRHFAQGSYTFQHAELGALTLFTVPVGPSDAGMTYEVLFS
jgi:ribosomal protein S18 acetylase RimI-like enzyme